MGKPSIFSRDYERKMRKRRKKIVISILFIVILSSVLFAFSKGNVMNLVHSNTDLKKWGKLKDKSSKQEDKNLTVDKNKSDQNQNSTTGKSPENKGSYDVALSDQTVKAVYDLNNNERKFKYIDPVSSQIVYSINPSGKAMLIYDNKVQNIIYINIDGKIVNATKNEYTASNGTQYPKDEALKNNPTYIWCLNPVFIDEYNVVYVSQLPWFNKNNTKYVWLLNTKDFSHRQAKDASGNDLCGEDIKIGSLNDKGILITIDGKNVFLSGDGVVSQ